MSELPPLPNPYATVLAYTGKYSGGGYCAEVQAETVGSIQERLFTADQMRAYAAAAVAAERERCAKVLDAEHEKDKHRHNYAAFYARMIRGL